MSTITRINTFVDDTTAYGSEVEEEFDLVVTAWNNHDSGASVWTVVSATTIKFGDGSAAAPALVLASAPTTGLYKFSDGLGFSSAGTKMVEMRSGSILAERATGSVTISNAGNISSITVQDGKTFTVTCESPKVFVVGLSNGDAALVYGNFTSSALTVLGSSGTIANTASPTAGQLGISKSANSHVISFTTGSSASGTFVTMGVCFLGSGVSAVTDFV